MVKINRRSFIKSAIFTGAAGALPGEISAKGTGFTPGLITTWKHGEKSARLAANLLKKGKKAIDVVENGVRVAEGDPDVKSVGYGGLPDESGVVTLDACIMDGLRHRAGSVAFLRNIKHPISVARRVMETTKHVMLVGEGALDFAKQNGFKEENLLTPEARKKWLEWKRKRDPKDNWLETAGRENEQNHDTITMLCLDKHGNLAGACTTSGLRWKIHGRVGDSPIIGAGLYVDNEVGAAGATGVGELVMQTLTSFQIVEFMRAGHSPSKACKLAFERMCAKIPSARKTEEAFIAINKNGEVGCATNSERFQYYYGSMKGIAEHKPKVIK
jgi:L-asparaginase/N4-(beta-N-acetylglucosaminyl)-L-asparaginase